MKLHVLSDLHLEFGGFPVPETDADVVVLAGDTRVLCNPRGYPGESDSGFRNRLVVRV